MSNRTGYVRDGRDWKKKTTGGCGLCFTISWNRLELYLKTGEILDFQRLKDDEHVDRFEVDEMGVTVFIVKADPKPDDSKRRCVHCNQFPDGPAACCNEWDGSFYWDED